MSDTSAFKPVRLNLSGVTPEEALKLLETNYNLLLDAVQNMSPVVSGMHGIIGDYLTLPKRSVTTKPTEEGELLFTGESLWIAGTQPNGVLFWAPIIVSMADKGK